VVPKEEQGVFIKPDMGAMVTFFNREIPETIRKAYPEEQAGLKARPKVDGLVPVVQAKDVKTP
jgi:hypothetical protein